MSNFDFNFTFMKFRFENTFFGFLLGDPAKKYIKYKKKM